jgi:hypothetical protein
MHCTSLLPARARESQKTNRCITVFFGRIILYISILGSSIYYEETKPQSNNLAITTLNVKGSMRNVLAVANSPQLAGAMRRRSSSTDTHARCRLVRRPACIPARLCSPQYLGCLSPSNGTASPVQIIGARLPCLPVAQHRWR